LPPNKEKNHDKYIGNSETSYRWNVYVEGAFVGTVMTDRKSEGAAKQAARQAFGTNVYTVRLAG